MSPFVERLDLATLEAGGANSLAVWMYRMWRENEGQLEQGPTLTKASQYLTVLNADAAEDSIPNVSFFGQQTLLSKYVPEAAPDHPSSYLGSDYLKLIHRGYHAAIDGQPWYDLVGTGHLLGPNRPELVYERFILPFRTRVGARSLFLLTIERHAHWPGHRSDRQGQSRSNRQRPGTGLFSPDLPLPPSPSVATEFRADDAG